MNIVMIERTVAAVGAAIVFVVAALALKNEWKTPGIENQVFKIMLGLLALLGFMAIAAGVDKLPEYTQGFALFKANYAIPALILHSFPSWFVGVAFAAIGIGAILSAALARRKWLAAWELYRHARARSSSAAGRCCSVQRGDGLLRCWRGPPIPKCEPQRPAGDP